MGPAGLFVNSVGETGMPCEFQTSRLGRPAPGTFAADWEPLLGSSTLGWRQKFGLLLGADVLTVFCELSHTVVGFFLIPLCFLDA